MIRLRRIISGGQTGVDRGALEAAEHLGLERGGYAPAGWLSEDGTIPEQYRLGMIELKNGSYPQRTRENLLEAGGTLILVRRMPLNGGTAQTRHLCKHHQRPFSVRLVDDLAACKFTGWWLGSVHTLNVAGPRESKEPGIQAATREALIALLGPELPPREPAFGWDPPA